MRSALLIFKTCMENKNINYIDNEKLYDDYKFKPNVESNLNEILDMFGLSIYDNSESGLFITPGVDNKIFGFSSDEIKKSLKVKNNAELSICYFIMYVIVVSFYRESSYISVRDYITLDYIIDVADDRVSMIKDALQSKQNTEESELDDDSFELLVKSWDQRDRISVKSKLYDTSKDITSQSKTAYVNRVLRFFCENKLLYKDNRRNVYTIEDRFSTIISYFYDDFNSKSEIIEYLEENYVDNVISDNKDDADDNNTANTNNTRSSEQQQFKYLE